MKEQAPKAAGNAGLSPLRLEGSPGTNTIARRGGFASACKAFFSRIFNRRKRHTLSSMPAVNDGKPQADTNGVIAVQTKTNKPSLMTKLLKGKNKGKRVRSPGGKKKGKPGSINVNHIGRPAQNKVNKVSQAPPSEHVDAIEVPDLLRKESTTVFAGRGRVYDSVMVTHSVFVDESSRPLELLRNKSDLKTRNQTTAEKLRAYNRDMPSVLEPTPISPVKPSSPRQPGIESSKSKPREKMELDRYSLASSVQSGTLLSSGKNENLQDFEKEPGLTPIDRTSRPNKANDSLLPAVGDVPVRQVVSASAASLDNIRVASGDKLYAQPQARAASADSFPLPKKDLRTSAKTSTSAQSDRISHMTPITMLQRGGSEVKTTLDRTKNKKGKGKGLFSSFMSGSSRNIKKRQQQPLSSGDEPANILVSRSYQKTKKKKKFGKIGRARMEDDSNILMSPTFAKTKARAKTANKLKLIKPDEI